LQKVGVKTGYMLKIAQLPFGEITCFFYAYFHKKPRGYREDYKSLSQLQSQSQFNSNDNFESKIMLEWWQIPFLKEQNGIN